VNQSPRNNIAPGQAVPNIASLYDERHLLRFGLSITSFNKRKESVREMNLPKIIQGGMGVAISNWRLARAVALQGQLGVVSGTGISLVLVGRLAAGDLDGRVRDALRHFPFQDQAQEILERYYIPGGKALNTAHRIPPVYTISPPKALDALTVIANFVEVFLAKAGHDGLIGINLLEKVQLPNIASLYGAMLAGVDVVIMGAGIPIQIARILDNLTTHQQVSYRLDVLNADKDDDYRIEFDPEKIFPGIAQKMGTLRRPHFLPIISSVVLAQALLKRSEGRIDGFVIEGATAGGHNAPPRGALTLNERGEPIYGEKDAVDLVKIRQLGLPCRIAEGTRRGCSGGSDRDGVCLLRRVGDGCHLTGSNSEKRYRGECTGLYLARRLPNGISIQGGLAGRYARRSAGLSGARAHL
jgi:nitronate monooxygenase